MFNVFPQGTGAAINRAVSPVVQGITNAFTNLTSGPLIRTGGRRQEPATPTVPTLPSGRPATGFDIYPTAPQMAPSFPTQRTVAATAPQPSAAMPASSNVPSFPNVGMGLMGNQNISPLPLEQVSPMTSISRIEGGPVSMNINKPLTAEAQGRSVTQTPYGTVYATAQQQQNMQAPRTIAQQSSRSPAEQQALLAQMRERGSAIGQRLAGQQEQYFKQVRAERAELAGATQAATLAGVPQETIRQARSQYLSQQPSSIAGIQRQFAGFLNTPSFGETPMSNRTAFVRAPFGIPSGGPQPAQMQTMATTSQPLSVGTGLNTTQRSWDNYVGPNPIESRVGTPFYDRSPRYGRRA
jgi:hypothetical protein